MKVPSTKKGVVLFLACWDPRLSSMPSARLVPDVISFNAAISACENLGFEF